MSDLPQPPVDVQPRAALRDEGADTLDWQRRLLPVMMSMVVALTMFFFATSLYQLYILHERIEQSPTLDLAPALNMITPSEAQRFEGNRLEFVRWHTLALLESHALQRRYHQAKVLLMTRVWLRYLGFVTGMILALVGAVFILGKLREPRSTLRAEGSGFGGSLSTASPGLVLAVLGTALMLTTIVTHNQIDVRDGPLYLAPAYATVSSERISPTKPEDVGTLTPGSQVKPARREAATSQEAGDKGREGGFDPLIEEAEKRLKQMPGAQPPPR